MKYNKKRFRRSSDEFELRSGDIGLMLTCFKGRENITSNELLNMISNESESHTETQSINACQTFSDAFESDLKSLGLEQSWKLVGMGDVKCIIFAKPTINTIDLPLKIALSIWDRALTTGVKLSRHGQRLVPIEASCKATPEALLELWPKFVSLHSDIFTHKFGFTVEGYATSGDVDKNILTSASSLSNGIITYAITVEKRLNDSITKEVIKELLASCISAEKGSNGEVFVVDLKKPQLTIMVQVVKGFLGISAIRSYQNKYKCGNIQLLADIFNQVNLS